MPGLQFLKGGQEGLVRRGDPVPLDFQSLQQPEQSPSSILSHLRAEILEGEGKRGRTLRGGLLSSPKSLLPAASHPRLPKAPECRGVPVSSGSALCGLHAVQSSPVFILGPPSVHPAARFTHFLKVSWVQGDGRNRPSPPRHTHRGAGSCQHL